MGKKRRREASEERIEWKIRRLEDKLKKRRKRIIVYSSEDELECPRDPSSHEGSPNVPAIREIFSPIEVTPPAAATEPHESGSGGAPILEHVPSTDTVPPLEPELPPSVPASSIPASEDVQLDVETLFLLGEAPEIEASFGKQVHKDLAARWLEILKKGLNKDTKEKLLKEYLIPSNCELLLPPILNSEVKVALADNFVKRDASMLARQKHLSVAVAALTQTVDKLISKTEYQMLKQEVLKPISDACRILCEMHYFETQTRKKFVTSSINNDLKETLVTATTDKFLFGENLSERLKNAKNVQKSAEVLKITHKVNMRSSTLTSKSRGNFRSLHQRRPDAGKTQVVSRQQFSYTRGRSAPRVSQALPPQQLSLPPPPPPPPPAPRRAMTRR